MKKRALTNEEVWEQIFSDFSILEKIAECGKFEITAGQIKAAGREPRLMAKFDHRNVLPAIFADNDLAILPTKRGGYVIAKFVAYEALPDIQAARRQPIKIGFPSHIKSLDYQNITSEAVALNCAYVSGMLAHFLEEKQLWPTVSGRMGSGQFTFNIQQAGGQDLAVDVTNAQIEIDSGLEGYETLTLVEAKNALPEDFIIRQLYYPYRLWHGRMDGQKRIRPVFMTYSNGIFTFFEYHFQDPEHYNSLTLVNQASYKIGPETIGFSDIREVYLQTQVEGEPPDTPFPQADSFERLINLCEILHEHGILTTEEITEHYAFARRQTDYYTNAGRYLDLIIKVELDGQTAYQLSKSGEALFKVGVKQRNLKFVGHILRQEPFRKTFAFYLSNGAMPELPRIMEYMRSTPVQNIDPSSTTYPRRAKTVEAWVNWIVNLPGGS